MKLLHQIKFFWNREAGLEIFALFHRYGYKQTIPKIVV
jgi:hypothetical protein